MIVLLLALLLALPTVEAPRLPVLPRPFFDRSLGDEIVFDPADPTTIYIRRGRVY